MCERQSLGDMTLSRQGKGQFDVQYSDGQPNHFRPCHRNFKLSFLRFCHPTRAVCKIWRFSAVFKEGQIATEFDENEQLRKIPTEFKLKLLWTSKRWK